MAAARPCRWVRRFHGHGCAVPSHCCTVYTSLGRPLCTGAAGHVRPQVTAWRGTCAASAFCMARHIAAGTLTYTYAPRSLSLLPGPRPDQAAPSCQTPLFPAACPPSLTCRSPPTHLPAAALHPMQIGTTSCCAPSGRRPPVPPLPFVQHAGRHPRRALPGRAAQLHHRAAARRAGGTAAGAAGAAGAARRSGGGDG